jgi:two-component sensor histidine kinase
MALIHESLYRSDYLLEIEFSDYLRELAGTLVRAYSVANVEVIVDVGAEGVALDIDQAVPCGLIVNELVSNSLKHGYRGRSGVARIRVDVRRIDGDYQLTVADDGVGFPDEVDFRNTQSLGMEIVCVLTAQLAGEIELIRDSGTCFRISFPCEEHEVAHA